MANYSKIKTFDIANGEGIRTSIFFSGCEFYCKGCFNSELWDFNTGESFTKEVYETKIKPTITEHIAGISILGGEPFHPKNVWDTFQLIYFFENDFPDKNIWVWTGYNFEDLFNKNNYEYYDVYQDILRKTDVLVDGRFIEEEKDLTLPWCGSKNQRVIDVQETLKNNTITLYY